jgi:nucleotide-binding universal stress UspA family protein
LARLAGNILDLAQWMPLRRSLTRIKGQAGAVCLSYPVDNREMQAMYKTIFINFSSPEAADLLSEVGAYMADRHKAHLVGVHNSASLNLYGGMPSDILAMYNDRRRKIAESIKVDFTRVASGRNLSFEWRHTTVPMTDAVAHLVDQARVADLIITCADDGNDEQAVYDNVPVRLALESGRPVMLVPAAGSFATIGERIAIAWSRSRESARAAFDALPLLRAAGTVTVISVNSTEEGSVHPGEDLANALSRHGINAQTTMENTNRGSEGDALLDAVADLDADFLVMGCYGHSRFREMVLGGVTRRVLSHLTIPVLMSH